MSSAHAFYRNILNPVMNRLLRSRLHGIVSKRVFAIRYSGHKTGRQFCIPVAYFSDGNDLYCFTDGNWWKNFATDRNVEVILRGSVQAALAQSVANDAGAIADVMQRVFSRQPHYAHHFGVKMNADGTADSNSVLVAARGLAMVKISLHSKP